MSLMAEESDTEFYEEEEKYICDTIFKMKCNYCQYPYPLEELSMCQHEECVDNKSVYCLKCGEATHNDHESKISHRFRSRQEEIPQSTPTDYYEFECKTQNNLLPDEKTIESQIEIALESRLTSNFAALDKLNVSLIQCEICLENYDVNEVYICENNECNNDGRILCQSCGDYCHERKTHAFKSKTLKCVRDLVKPENENKYEFYSDESSTTDTIIRRHLQISVRDTLSTVTLGVVEQAYIWNQWYKEKITLREALRLSAVSLVSNSVSAASFIGVMALGAAVGSPGGPVGIIIGAVVAAVICGITTRYGINKAIEYYHNRENQARKKLKKEALLFFFGNKNYDINNPNKFNKQILSKQYRKLALKYHPDRNRGDQTEWLRLCSYYGVLTAVYEQNVNENDVLDNGIDNMGSEQKRLIVNALIKENASLVDTISLNHSLTESSVDDSSYENTLSSICTEHSHLSTEAQEFCLKV